MSEEQAIVKRGKQELRARLEGDDFKNAVAQVLPKHLTPDRFVRAGIMAITRTPKLVQCDQASFFGCMMALSQYGLEPDGRRAHLIPFENKKRKVTECQLIIDYKGLAELAMRSGMISFLHADVVRENDEFEWNMGRIVKHRINFREPRGQAYAAYATATTKDGGVFSEVLTKDEVLSIRDGSQGWKSFQKGYAYQSPWDPKNETSEKEMWKKTAFRRLSKWLPLSPEFHDAQEHDADRLETARFEQAKPINGAEMFGLPEPEPATANPSETPDSSGSIDTLPETPQQALCDIVIGAGHTFDDFQKWALETGHIDQEYGSFEELPAAVAQKWVEHKGGMLSGLALGKGAK